MMIFCVSSVNSTSVVFIGVHSGAQMGVDVAGSRKNTSVFHLNLNKWTELADIDLGQNYDFEKCAATTIFSKESGKSQIYAIICKCLILKIASILTLNIYSFQIFMKILILGERGSSPCKN